MTRSLKSIAALALFGLCAVASASAQGRKELRINEVMVVNDSSIVDDFGRHSAWIELINPTQAAVNISSIYLTNDSTNPTKYFVPTGDVRTKVEKGQTVLFFADGEPNNGTFHLNFDLVPGRDNYVAIYDADGINLIDSVTIPAALPAGASLARTPDAGAEWQVRNNSSVELAITPGGHNNIRKPNQKIKNFKEMDQYGGAMTVMAMCIVFSALLVLCLCFYLIKRLSSRKSAAPKAPEAAAAPASNEAEIAAAIALALHLQQQSSNPAMRLTITHNPASAWTSKINAMRVVPSR